MIKTILQKKTEREENGNFGYAKISILWIASSFLLAMTILAFFPNTASAGSISLPPNNLGLVGYWSFEDATGTKATDFSGNGNVGTLTNMDANTDWVQGKIGKALNFNANSDYNDRVLFSRLLTQVPYTISAWIKPDTCGQIWQGNGIFYQGAAATQIGTVLSCTNIPGTNNYISFNNAEGGWVGSSSESVTLGVWQLVTATIDASGNVVIYVNGVVKGTGTSGTGAPANTSAYFGFWSDISDQTRYFDGMIDDIRIYSRALSATEISNLYSRSSKSQKVKSGITNNGLVGYWSFEDATGTKATDFSGNGNTGTLTNMDATTDWVAGKIGKALDFDGSNDYVSSSRVLTQVPYTISAWIKPDTCGPDWQGNGIFYQGAASGQIGTYFSCVNIPGTTNTLGFVNAEGTGVLASSESVTLGAWQLATVTIDASGNVVIYVNGVVKGTGNSGTGAPANTSSFIGFWYSAGDPVRYFNGSLDDVRVYNRALTATEITSLYNSTKSTKVNSSQNHVLTDGLVGLWSFDGPDISGTTAYDRSGSGNNGTLTNGPLPTAGKIGQGMSFDGSNDYMSIAESASMESPTTQITVSAWIKITGSTGNTQDIVFKDYGSGTGWESYGFGYLNDGTIYLSVLNGAGEEGGGNAYLYYATTSTVPMNTWIHVVGKWQYTGNPNTDGQLYINGQATTTTKTYSLGTLNSIAYGSGGSGYVGAGIYNVTYHYFNGSIDDVRIYNRALSTSEIQMLYNIGR